MRISYKKMLPLIAVSLLLLSVLIMPSFAPKQPTIIGILQRILSSVKDIRGWFNPQGGTYSKTPQIETGEGHVVFEPGLDKWIEYYHIYEAPADGKPVYKITITMFLEKADPSDEVRYAVHLGPTEERREFSTDLIQAGWPTTNEFVINGADHFKLWMEHPLTDVVEVWYNYVVMYEP